MGGGVQYLCEQPSEVAEVDDHLVEDVAQAKVGGQHRALPEASNGLLHNVLVLCGYECMCELL